jgi:pantoate kinase
MKGVAFAPGHISAFFEPKYNATSVDRTGSRGAGINVTFGAISRVHVLPAPRLTCAVRINGRPSNAPVTKAALKYLLGNTPLNVSVETTLDLPESQGFGMSGSGALSATLAASELLGYSREQAVRAAHYAEVQSHTGLGDVIASSFGGIEIRREPGLPPWGVLEHIPGDVEVVLCVVGKAIRTVKVLTNKEKLGQIASSGRFCTKQLLEHPSLEHLFSLGWEFTRKINIAEPQVLKAIEVAQQFGLASMCMLGNSLFAVGKTLELQRTLAAFGPVWVCGIDQTGARLIEE